MKEAPARNPNGNGAAKVAAGTAAATVVVAAPVIEAEIIGAHDEVHDDKSEQAEHHEDEQSATNGRDHESSGYFDDSHEEESFKGHVEEPEEMSHEGASHEVESEEHVEAEENAEVEEPSIVVEPDLLSSHYPEGNPHELGHETEPEAEVDVEETHVDESSGDDAPAEPRREDANVLSPHPAPADENTKETVEPVVEPAGNDIDHIVNLLETAPAVSASKPRSMSVASIPDDAPDIPDEE